MLLDIGVGILSALFVGSLFSVPPNLVFVTVGILFALSPDTDFIVHLGKGGTSKDAYRHRDLFHKPLVFIPLGMAGLALVSLPYAVLFGIASFLHFVHDSIGIGWGVQWLWPLQTDHFNFLYRYQPHKAERLPYKFMYAWKHHDIDRLNIEFGDTDWFQNIYLQWHPYAIAEIAVFCISLLVLYFSIPH